MQIAVGDALKILLQGTAPPVAVSPPIFAALTAKLTNVLHAAERDSAASVDKGATLMATQMLPRIQALAEENDRTKKRLREAEQRLHTKDAELREKSQQLAQQVEHTNCYRDMAETYTAMYIRAANVAQSLQSMQSTFSAGERTASRAPPSPHWLDSTMEVPVVRLRTPPPPPSISSRAQTCEDEAGEEDEDDLRSSLSDEEENDVLEIMMKNDIRKYGPEKTSRRWACHRYIFHHLALKDARDDERCTDVFPSAEDGRMYS